MNAQCKGDPLCRNNKGLRAEKGDLPQQTQLATSQPCKSRQFPKQKKDASLHHEFRFRRTFHILNMVESVGPFYFKIQVPFKPFGCCRCPQRFRGPPKFNTPTEDAVLRSLFNKRRDVSLFYGSAGKTIIYIKCISVCVYI